MIEGLDPNRPVPAPGSMGVDFEERVDFGRLRTYRLGRARRALDASDLGRAAAVRRQQHPLRQLDDDRRVVARQDDALLPAHPHRAARSCGTSARPPSTTGSTRRGCDRGLQRRPARPARRDLAGGRPLRERPRPRSTRCLNEAGVERMPLGSGLSSSRHSSSSCRSSAITVVDGQQTMHDAREIKSYDEILLLSTSAAMVDGAYQDIVEALKPGDPREPDRRARDQEALRARCRRRRVDQRGLGRTLQPAPAQLFAIGIIRPGEQAFFDIMSAFNGYRTCYYRTFIGRLRDAGATRRVQARREWIDASIDADPAGRHDRRRRARVAEGRRVRLLERDGSVRLAVRARSRTASARAAGDLAAELDRSSDARSKTGMVFALETYCPATDGYSAARIEEEIVVTSAGPKRHHALPGAGTVRHQPLRLREATAMMRDARPTTADARRETRIALYRLQYGCACSKSAPTICSCRTSSRARAISRSGRKRSPPASRPRCGATTGRSARIAATITRSRAA